MSIRLARFLWLGSLCLLLLGAVAFAQDASLDEIPTAVDENGELIEIGNGGGGEPPAGAVSCFDYYHFGSVQANITTNLPTVVSGTNVFFTGTLTNNNPYPIVDGALYIKIFKKRTSENDGNGPDVIDQFFAADNIVIPPNGSVPVSFRWRVPAYAESGEYQVATFFATSRKFNLLGLSFTDDVVGNTVRFSVVGDQEGSVAFDKSRVTVSDDPYYFASYLPRESATDPVEVVARVENTTGEEQTATVFWAVYQWDALLRENVVQEETQSVRVPAGGSAPVTLTVSNSAYPVYLAVGTLSWNDAKSVINVRFAREGIDRTRINFPGVMSFPLVAGEENTLFSCLHNSGSGDMVSGSSLDLRLTDRDGNIIDEYRYDGDVSGAMMGIASHFTPKKYYDYFLLEARLYQNGEFVDEANLVYDCALIDPDACRAQGSGGWSDTFGGFADSGRTILFVLAGVIVLIVLVALLKLVHAMSAPKPPADPLSGL